MTKALYRRIFAGIKALGDDIQVEEVRQARHYVLRVSRPGIAPRVVSTSISPKNVDHAVLNAVRDARRALGITKESTCSQKNS